MSRFVGTLKQKAEKLGMDSELVHQRVRRGWTEEEALLTPVGDRRPDRVSTTTPFMARTVTMVAAAEAQRLSGNEKLAEVVEKLINGED